MKNLYQLWALDKFEEFGKDWRWNEHICGNTKNIINLNFLCLISETEIEEKCEENRVVKQMTLFKGDALSNIGIWLSLRHFLPCPDYFVQQTAHIATYSHALILIHTISQHDHEMTLETLFLHIFHSIPFIHSFMHSFIHWGSVAYKANLFQHLNGSVVNDQAIKLLNFVLPISLTVWLTDWLTD